MRVKLCVVREIEIEVNDPAIAELDAHWREHGAPVESTPGLDALVSKAIKAVEEASNLPFGDENAPETISAVLAMDGEAIIEW